MPWNELPMSELRLAFVKLVDVLHYSVAHACREFGVSRKTGYKWLRRARQQPGLPLADQSRRPRSSPGRTAAELEQQILEVRDRYGWGGRKIHAFLASRGLTLPSRQTVQHVLQRHGRVSPPAAVDPHPPQRFEHAQPNDLWQLDFKGPVEVEHRRVFPFAVLDDHSRYLLTLAACLDCTMATAWDLLWQTFAEAGLPQAILSDNAFGTRGQNALGVSWFEARLIRLGIHPWHGRPYHPQTQGKIERLNGTLQGELWPRVRRDSLTHFHADLQHWRTEVYNSVRPHEALADCPPLTRWRPSPRPRPAVLPAVSYPTGSVLRKVMNRGDISWRGYRLLVGAGLEGDWVRLEEREQELAVFYACKQLRCLRLADLVKGRLL
jgi:transposase InsO family protein